MKYPKILSLTLANGFGFLIFGSILAGCQKSVIHKSGFLTSVTKQSEKGFGRMPASAGAKYEDFQDTKQIFVYCQLNDLNPKQCYQRHLEESVKEFSARNHIPGDQFEKILAGHTFEMAKTHTDSAMNQVFMAITPSINKLVEKRIDFCKKNAQLYLDRCLKQYVKKETFQVLNGYQEANANMNGHEYLFLKSRIEKRLTTKLNSAANALQNAQKKKI